MLKVIILFKLRFTHVLGVLVREYICLSVCTKHVVDNIIVIIVIIKLMETIAEALTNYAII
jgi:hypothetical protein